MGWMALWWVLLPVLIAALAWAALKGARTPNSSSESPEEILRRRYARGDVDDETFRHMLEELRQP